MLIGLWGYYEQLYKNGYILTMPDAGIGSDLLKPINSLYQEFERKGHTLKTLDMIKDNSSIDALIFLDYPKESNQIVQNAFFLDIPKYLIAFESVLIHPDNWSKENQSKFEKIFTWNDDFIDSIKFVKTNFSYDFPKIKRSLTKRNFCTMIASNKKVTHPLELYSKRVEVIRWFERYRPQGFDLYGVGWNDHLFTGSKLIRALNRIKPLTKLFASDYPSYKGSVKDKISTLESYKFSICFENARDIPGYITEKIFDCFFAGCIPIYWGANNVAEHIPAECYIDMRNFPDIGSMYDFLTSMSNEDYLNRLNEIDKFIHSEKSYPFSIDYFVKTIVEQVTNK